jgi:hypothetical protein
VCLPCSSQCKSCTSSGCIQCYTGYSLMLNVSTYLCSPNCISPCSTCQFNAPTTCTSCITGYAYDSNLNACTPSTTCNGPCPGCPIGYALSGGLCYQCQVTNCGMCNPTDVSKCYSCVDSYYVSNNVCTPCTTGCATCLSQSACSTCSSGYTLGSKVGSGY